MRIFRITRERYAGRALQGDGTLRAQGRWHTQGARVAYTATHASLALLEMLVHIDRQDVPADYVLMTFELADSQVRTASALPDGWDAYPYQQAAQAVGDAWLLADASLALAVPSAIVPEERNILVNPAHPAFGRIRHIATRPVGLDDRLLGGPPR